MEKQTAKQIWIDSIEHDLYGCSDVTLIGNPNGHEGKMQTFKIGGIEWQSPALLEDPSMTTGEKQEACLDEVAGSLDEYLEGIPEAYAEELDNLEKA